MQRSARVTVCLFAITGSNTLNIDVNHRLISWGLSAQRTAVVRCTDFFFGIHHLRLQPFCKCRMWCPPRFSTWSSTFHHVYNPLSTLISSLFLKHHLYADDTQVFFSFYPSDLDANITLLRNALQHISSWMTANPVSYTHLTLPTKRIV